MRRRAQGPTAEAQGPCSPPALELRTPLRLPAYPIVRVELRRGSFVKRRADGTVDFYSPVPCPYDYGSLEGLRAADGDDVDALVIGPPARAARLRLPVRAVLGFVDAGCFDPKVICSERPLDARDAARLLAFCRLYARAKGLLHRARRAPGPTRCLGFLPWAPAAAAGSGGPPAAGGQRDGQT